jgi:hypothetical protein
MRHYGFAVDLNRDAVNVRVWSGIDFGTADIVADGIGTDMGDRGLDPLLPSTLDPERAGRRWSGTSLRHRIVSSARPRDVPSCDGGGRRR